MTRRSRLFGTSFGAECRGWQIVSWFLHRASWETVLLVGTEVPDWLKMQDNGVWIAMRRTGPFDLGWLGVQLGLERMSFSLWIGITDLELRIRNAARVWA
jgi:hypothetical protein